MTSTNGKKDFLIDIDLCSWNEEEVPLAQRGVNMGWIIDYVNSIYDSHNKPRIEDYKNRLSQYRNYEYQKKAANHFSHVPEPEWQPHPSEPRLFQLSTRQFVSSYVIPETEAIKAPLYARVPHSERGKPTIFLSHAWDAKMHSLRWAHQASQKCDGKGTLDAFSSLKDQCVWIDFVCYNQHKIDDKKIAFDMESLIGSIGNVSFAVTPVPLFNRIWCLWELLSIARTNAKIHFSNALMHFTDFKKSLNDFFESFTSVTKAQATKQSDYVKIIDAMKSYFGSTQAADNFIRKLMRGDMKKFLYSSNLKDMSDYFKISD